ncbi:MAG: citrate synthase, partial [Eubacteriales bacterium]
MSTYISPISNETLTDLCKELGKDSKINSADFDRYGVKRGLRNSDGTGVMAGLTKICSVEGYYINDGERVPKEGRLIYRGIDMLEIVEGCHKEDRFGFEEVAWLLLFGSMPSQKQLDSFCSLLAQCRELPEDFIEDMIMKAPSPDIMNKLARSVMALYSYDKNPDDTSIENVLRQSIQLLAQLPTIMSYAYQVKRRHYYHKSLYIHPIKPEHGTAQTVLNSIRSDRKFSLTEARLLDLCLILHAEHGGGNNSTFATRVLTSSGTDTYSAIAAGIGSLKGPKHGGANIKVAQMLQLMQEEIANPTDEGQVADYLIKLIDKQVGDHSGLVYG